MFYLKIAMIYAILFLVTASVTLGTSFNNPALAFFIPSVFAMMAYGKAKMGGEKVNTAKHALFCGLTFALITVIITAVLQSIYGWLNNPLMLYAMAFGGNFLFPFLLFPKIKNAQNP